MLKILLALALASTAAHATPNPDSRTPITIATAQSRVTMTREALKQARIALAKVRADEREAKRAAREAKRLAKSTACKVVAK